MRRNRPFSLQIAFVVAICLAVLLQAPDYSVRAGGPLRVGGSGIFGPEGAFITFNVSPIPYRVDGGSLGLDSNATVVTMTNNLFTEWQNIATSSVAFMNAGAIASVPAGGSCVGGFSDGDVSTFDEFNCVGTTGNPIIFDNTGVITDTLFGAGNSTLGFAGPTTTSGPPAFFSSARAVINGRFRDGNMANGETTFAQLEATMLHEFGHYFGLEHSQINNNCLSGVSCADFSDDTFGLPTMYPISISGLEESAGVPPERTLSDDDIAWASRLYPDASFAMSHGTISGTVVFNDGLSPFQGANIIARRVNDPGTPAIDESRRNAVSVVSGYLFTASVGQMITGDNNTGDGFGSRNTALIGAHDIRVPAGFSYNVEVEAIDPAFLGGSSVGPSEAFNGGQYPLPAGPPAPITNVGPVTGGGTFGSNNFVLPGALSRMDAFDSVQANDTIGAATPVSNGMPAVTASISPFNTATSTPDIDVYAFTAMAGVDVTFEIFSRRAPHNTFMDPVIEITDAAGIRQTTCDSAFVSSPGPPPVLDGYDGIFNDACIDDDINPLTGNDRDSRLLFRPAASGVFYLRVFDWRGDARPDFLYNLNVSGAGQAPPPAGCDSDFDNGGADSNWFTATNWNPDGVPGTNDAACIGAAFSVNFNGTGQVDSLFDIDGTLNIAGGTLTVNTSASISGTLVMNGGTINLPNSNIANLTMTTGTLNATMGTVNLPPAGYTHNGGALRLVGGSASTAGTINLVNGTIEGGAPGTLTANINQTGGEIRPGLSPGILNVTGTFVQSAAGGVRIEIAGTSGPGSPTGHDQVNISGSATVDGTFFIVLTAFAPAIGDSFTVATCGFVNCGGGNTQLDFSMAPLPPDRVWVDVGPPTNNMLVLQVQAATKDFDGGGDGSSWTDAMNWTGDTLPINTDNVQIGVNPIFAGPFTVTKSGAGGDSINSLTIANGQGVFTLSSNLDINSASTIGNGGFTMNSGGDLTGLGSLTVNGLFTWTDGMISGNGTLNTNGGALLPLGSRNLLRTWNNAGNVTHSGSGSLVNAGATINHNSGTWNATGDAGISGGGTFNNNADFTVAGPSSPLAAYTVSGLFNNTGTVSINSGSLSLSGGGTSSGPFTLGAGAFLKLLRFDGAHNLSGGITGTGAVTFVGTQNLTGGTYDVTNVNPITTEVLGGTTTFGPGVTLVNLNGLSLLGGTLVLNSGEAVSVPLLSINGGTLSGSDNVTVTGSFAWSGGTISGSGAVNLNGGGDITGGVVLDTRALNLNNTTLTFSGGGSMSMANGASFNITGASGNLVLDNDGSISLSGGSASLTLGAGSDLIRSTSAGTFTIGVPLTNNGADIVVSTGTLAFTSTFTQNAGLTRLTGGNVSATGTLLINGGTLDASSGRTISGNVNNAGGVLAPGMSPGILNITGNYTQGAGGTLNIELGGTTPGTQFDVLNITGMATLAGTLNINQFLGFTPAGGSSFQMMTFASLSGDFTTINNNSGNAMLTTVPGGTNYLLNFAAAACGVNAVASGDWANTATWDTATVPTATDNVCIDADMFNVPVSMGAQAANSLTVSGTVNPFTLSGGSLTLASASSIAGAFSQSGGTLDGPGVVDITGAFTWSSGTQNGPGTTNANGGMTLSTGGTKTLNTGRTLNNNAAATWTDGEFFIGNGAVFTNSMTGTFDIQHAGTRNFGGGVGGGSTVNNAGTMVKSAGGGLTVVNAGFNNSGTFNANDGTFRLISATNPSTSTGAFNVGAGTLEFNNGTYDLNSGATVSGAGTTTIPSGTVNFNAGSSLTTAVSMSGGVLNLTTGGTVTLPSLTQGGGTVTGTDTLAITGVFTWSAGDHTGASTTNANGGMTMSTGGTKTLNNGRTLSNNGAATWTDGEFFIGNGAVFANGGAGVFDIQHTGTRNFGGGVGGSSAVNNIGTMTKSAGGGLTVVNAGFNNTGTFNANDGTFRLISAASPSTSTGTFNVGAGTLEFNNGTYDLNSGATVSGAGTITVPSGTVNFNAGSSLTTAVSMSGGVLNLTTGGTVTLPSLTQGGGTVTGTDTLAITGVFTWSAGTQQGAGTTNANGVLTLSSGGTKTLNNGRTLNNDGGATWSDGEFFIGNGAVFTNTINGLFDIQHAGTRNFGGGVGGVSTVNNDGTITKSAGAGSTVVNAAYNNNAGSVLNLNSGTMAFSTSFTQSGGSTTLNGGNLAGGITFNFNGGTLGGVGTITGNVNNAGAMLGPGLSAGTLNIMGNYIQGAAGALNTEIDGPAAGQFDVLNITGTAMLAGTLNVSSSTAFMPGAGSTFQIMTYASVSGDFATKNGLNLATPPFIGSPQSTFYLLTNVINADLAVTKTDTPDPVNVGGNVTYTVTITNNGPDPATGVTLTDTLPANSAFVSAMTTVGSCGAPVAGVLTCNIGNLANAASAVVTIIVTPNATAVPSITNTASATANENDPNAADNTNIMQTTTVNAVADLSVTKTDAPDPVTQGQNVTYTITVTNNGPSTATNVMLSDTLPAGTTFVSFTVPAGWTAMTPAVGGTGTVTATNPSVASAAVEMFTLVVSTNAAAVPSISNTATVSGAEVDPNAADNSASATTTVNPLTADLTVTKTDALDPVNVGDNVTYTITVTNNGPDPASNVSLTDIVPTGTTFVSFTAPAGWTAMTPAVGGTGTVTATNPSLATGTPQVFTLVVQTAAAAVPSISNTASVTAVENDPVPANNSATEATTVNPLIDLSVTKTDAPDPVLAGANIVYTVTVANAGPSNATNVSLTDTLPANTAFVSASPSQGTCPTLMAGVLTCNLGTINSGAMATMTLTVTTTAASVPSVTNMASVTAAETDTNAANDSDTEVTTVNPAADVAVTKTDSPDPVNVGANITYTITVTNNGPSPATNVSLSDMLPAGTTFVSLTAPAGWTLTTPAVGAGGTVTATNPALAAATPQTFTLVVAAGPTAVPSVSNTATVTAAEPDGNAANNSATATTTVNPLADLSITKTDSPDPVNNQSNITYTITVSNAGPSPAANVTVTDNVPAGTTFVSATPTQGTCPAPVGGVVTCNLGMMASGANVTITMIVTVTGFGPTVTNTATVASSVTDPVAANDSASTTTTVNVVIGNDFSITASPSIQNATPGSTATYTVTLTPIPAGSAFTNPIGLACFVQPPLSSCSFNPQTVTPGASPANSTLSVVVPTFAVAPPVGGPVNTAPPLTLWLLAMSLALVGTGVAGRRLARQNLALAPLGRRMGYCVTAGLVLLVLSMGMAQSACVTANHHITGPYTVTISGSAPGGLSHSTTVTVNVQQP